MSLSLSGQRRNSFRAGEMEGREKRKKGREREGEGRGRSIHGVPRLSNIPILAMNGTFPSCFTLCRTYICHGHSIVALNKLIISFFFIHKINARYAHQMHREGKRESHDCHCIATGNNLKQ